MTESEWLECTDPTPMLEIIQGRTGQRRQRLFACACCRRVWHMIARECARWKGGPELYYRALEVTERYAEGDATREELQAHSIGTGGDRACDAFSVANGLDGWDEPLSTVAIWASVAASPDTETIFIPDNTDGPAGPTQRAEQDAQCRLIRDIFGNPFRPVSINPSWLTPTVLNLGQSAYDERSLPSGELDRDRLAVLSDALEEVGCDESILDHLRDPGPHVRGCWALDLILAKDR